MCTADIFLGFLAILFPPLPVWVKTGVCSADSIINILLCMLGFLPGLLHAWYIIARFPELPYEEDGRVTYVYVQSPAVENGGCRGGQQRQPQPRSPGMNYGTTNQSGAGASSTAAQAGSSRAGADERAPPTYAEAIKGDNKIQTQD